MGHILTVCMEKKEKGLMSLMAEGKVDDYLQWHIQSISPVVNCQIRLILFFADQDGKLYTDSKNKTGS